MAHHSSNNFMAGPGDRRLPGLNGAHPDTKSFVTSRETGDIIPDTAQNPAMAEKASPFAKSWVHFVAGG
jgi:solute carrier family 25 protein 33/36